MKHPQTSTHASTDVAVKKKSAGSGKNGNGKDRSAVDSQGRAGDEGRDEIIRQTAYFFYEARGYVDGNDLDDWLRAEVKVKQMPGRETSSS